MALTNFAIFKKHVRADDYEADDDLLAVYLEAATVQVVNETGYTREELEAIPFASFPEDLKVAIYMRGASMYAQREDVDLSNLGMLPLAYKAIIKPYCKMNGGGRLEALVEEYNSDDDSESDSGESEEESA